VQRLICIAGMCITSLLAVLAWGLKNPRLGEGQSLEDEQLVLIGTVEKDGTELSAMDRKVKGQGEP
jgi:hypothetical protein